MKRLKPVVNYMHNQMTDRIVTLVLCDEIRPWKVGFSPSFIVSCMTNEKLGQPPLPDLLEESFLPTHHPHCHWLRGTARTQALGT